MGLDTQAFFTLFTQRSIHCWRWLKEPGTLLYTFTDSANALSHTWLFAYLTLPFTTFPLKYFFFFLHFSLHTFSLCHTCFAVQIRLYDWNVHSPTRCLLLLSREMASLVDIFYNFALHCKICIIIYTEALLLNFPVHPCEFCFPYDVHWLINAQFWRLIIDLQMLLSLAYNYFIPPSNRALQSSVNLKNYSVKIII